MNEQEGVENVETAVAGLCAGFEDSEQSKKYQTAALRGGIGPTGLEVYSGLPFIGAGDRDDTVKILELPEGYYIGKTNVLQSDNLSLDGCVSICSASELAGAQ